MPAANTRITITPTSEAHSVLLNNWAILEGRTLSNLCSSLLENAINEAISKRTVNPQALEMMNELINVRRNQLKFEYGKTLSQEQEKAENYLNEISAQAQGDPEDLQKFDTWTARAEEVWGKETTNEKERNKVVQEPDLETITNCVKALNLYAQFELDALKLLTQASMEGIDIEKITNSTINLNIDYEGSRVEALQNFYDSFSASKGLAKKDDPEIEFF
tara:strand:+ start:17 stop:673 length:657 start_codon:yes stop_codon:yes gene_type:complete